MHDDIKFAVGAQAEDLRKLYYHVYTLKDPSHIEIRVWYMKRDSIVIEIKPDAFYEFMD